jgi:hypothetical protein
MVGKQAGIIFGKIHVYSENLNECMDKFTKIISVYGYPEEGVGTGMSEDDFNEDDDEDGAEEEKSKPWLRNGEDVV